MPAHYDAESSLHLTKALHERSSVEDSTAALASNLLATAGITSAVMMAAEKVLGAPEAPIEITGGAAAIFLAGAVASRLYLQFKS